MARDVVRVYIDAANKALDAGNQDAVASIIESLTRHVTDKVFEETVNKQD